MEELSRTGQRSWAVVQSQQRLGQSHGGAMELGWPCRILNWGKVTSHWKCAELGKGVMLGKVAVLSQGQFPKRDLAVSCQPPVPSSWWMSTWGMMRKGDVGGASKEPLHPTGYSDSRAWGKWSEVEPWWLNLLTYFCRRAALPPEAARGFCSAC